MNTEADDFWAWVSLGWALGLVLGLMLLWVIQHPPSPCKDIYIREAHLRCLQNK